MRAEDLVLLHSPEEIGQRVLALGGEISRDYPGKLPLMVCVLQGAFVFFSDLVRQVTVPMECDFVQASSYKGGRTSSGHVEIVGDLRGSVSGRHVILVEDIVDTGRTARALLDEIRHRGPESLHLCALLDKAQRRQVEVPIRYTGFVVTDRFVVGYGLDLDGRHRNRPGLWTLPNETRGGDGLRPGPRGR